MTPSKITVPYGYCQCGCGQKTKLALENRPKRGWVRGKPMFRIYGHGRRVPRPKIEQPKTHKLIPIANGKVMLVSNCDFQSLSKLLWHTNNAGYACAWVDGVRTYAHRIVTNAPAGVEVDHKNRIPLDNRRSNLRLATHSQNGANKILPVASTGYRGVYRASKNRWHARIKGPNRESLYLGSFSNPHDAARRFNEAAREKYGEFAVLNEVSDEA